MAAPEAGSEYVPAWLQMAAGIVLFLMTAVGSAWRYLNGLNSEPEKAQVVVLEQAELADMRAVRVLGPTLAQISTQLQQVFQIVNDNHRIMEDSHRIVENNERMLVLLQRIDQRMEVDEQLEERMRQHRIDDILKRERDKNRAD